MPIDLPVIPDSPLNYKLEGCEQCQNEVLEAGLYAFPPKCDVIDIFDVSNQVFYQDNWTRRSIQRLVQTDKGVEDERMCTSPHFPLKRERGTKRDFKTFQHLRQWNLETYVWKK
ncbi:hypothetical protein CEXT_658471 [Caerostris extrusa]|uniref:Uncharacterized protein n=1 Tax=Caerostris extrusa TaxID=172846 RepID=A0AAV4PW17_CAEEX|nr:hypothetical protein CEXT_658471 [Caerostris extrusa]